jgi:Cof subfamily protein (haloacid dehalogenase superfamily)
MSVRTRLFVVDLDGTLLRRDNTIHPHDVAAVRTLQRGGVHVSIATGRMFSGSVGAARALGIAGPIACVDGSHIVEAASERDLHRAAIQGEHAELLRLAVHEHDDGAAFVFTRDAIFHDERGAPFATYVQTWSPVIEQVERVASHGCWAHESGVMALVAVGVGDHIPSLARRIEERVGHATQTLTFPIDRLPGAFGMVTRARGHSKGTGVRWLAAHHGLSLDEVAVVGDWLNDAPMFEVAGRSFAMAQAPEALRLLATDVLEASGKTGGGVAEAARRARPDLFGAMALADVDG